MRGRDRRRPNIRATEQHRTFRTFATNERTNERTNFRTNELSNERTFERTNFRTNERTNFRTNERSNERSNERRRCRRSPTHRPLSLLSLTLTLTAHCSLLNDERPFVQFNVGRCHYCFALRCFAAAALLFASAAAVAAVVILLLPLSLVACCVRCCGVCLCRRRLLYQSSLSSVRHRHGKTSKVCRRC